MKKMKKLKGSTSHTFIVFSEDDANELVSHYRNNLICDDVNCEIRKLTNERWFVSVEGTYNVIDLTEAEEK